MNIRLVLFTLGKVTFLEGFFMLLPFFVSLYYGESTIPFIMAMLLAFATGALLMVIFKSGTDKLYAREGFAITTFCWILLSVIGAVPFVVSGTVSSFADAVFETMSGFTTTGASILTDVESVGRGMLFWRSFTHWIGGMGVLVFLVAIAEKNPNRSINILKAEMPGSKVDKLRPRARTTARVLYYIYIVMTLILIVLLAVGDMSIFDSVVHSFGTAGTGGFGIKADSVASYSAYSQYVIAIFMLLFGVNFSFYFMILLRRWKSAIRLTEIRWYLSIVGIAVLTITIVLMFKHGSFEESFRLSLFQVASIVTTTGYATTDFNLWHPLAKTVLFLLMFIGGCEGSTAGGLKVSRVMVLLKNVKVELKRAIHPRLITGVRVNDKAMPPEIVHGIGAYLALYLLILCSAFILISFEPMGFETNFTAVVTCINNVGPGFADVGPAGSFAAYSDATKVMLTALMMIGRLEIYPVLLTLFPGMK